MDLTQTAALLLAALIYCSPSGSALGQSWRQSFSARYPLSWSSVVSSADGSKLLAAGNVASGAVVYTSTDSGATWTSNSAPFTGSACLASSADLTKLLAGATGGGVWTSTNGGATWEAVRSLPSLNWSSAASTTDGTRLVVTAASDQTRTNLAPFRGNGSIYTSTDSGLTWRSNNIPCNCWPNPAWNSVACSADGQKLVVAGGPAGLYHSADAGTSWTPVPTPFFWAVAVVSSADGSRLLASGLDALDAQMLAVSTNSGQSWQTSVAPDPSSVWGRLASSADGIKLTAAGCCNPVYTSADCGLTWVAIPDPSQQRFSDSWCSVASSADGSKLVALANNYGQIYTWQYQPALSISLLANNAVVSWPRSSLASGFVLQANSNLWATNWTDVPLPIHDDGTNLGVTVGPITNSLLFRLKK